MALGQFTYLSGITKIRPQSPATWCIQFQYGKLTNTLESEQSVVAELNFEHKYAILTSTGSRQNTPIHEHCLSKLIGWRYAQV